MGVAAGEIELGQVKLAVVGTAGLQREDVNIALASNPRVGSVTWV